MQGEDFGVFPLFAIDDFERPLQLGIAADQASGLDIVFRVHPKDDRGTRAFVRRVRELDADGGCDE